MQSIYHIIQRFISPGSLAHCSKLYLPKTLEFLLYGIGSVCPCVKALLHVKLFNNKNKREIRKKSFNGDKNVNS